MLTATRWTKYGNDRLYVNDGPDMRVGWVDLKTGSAVLEREEYAEEFNSIVTAHLHPPVATVDPTPVEMSKVDLSQNKAGESVKVNRPGSDGGLVVWFSFSPLVRVERSGRLRTRPAGCRRARCGAVDC